MSRDKIFVFRVKNPKSKFFASDEQGLAAAAAAARAVMEDGGGPYPYPSPRSSTLLPGQTYPDPSPVKPAAAGNMAAISSLQEVLIQRDIRAIGGNSGQTNPDTESPPPPLYPKQYHQVAILISIEKFFDIFS
jgi:hypothetical protein